MRIATDPRASVLAAAFAIEGVALALWPTIYLADTTDGPSRLGEIFLTRYPFLGGLLTSLKSVVDWLFPGALWTWDQLVPFFFHSVTLAFAAYAFAAWRLTEGTGEATGNRQQAIGVGASPPDPSGPSPHASRLTSHASPGLRWIIVPLLVFQATLVLIPATLTTDIFNYLLYGEMPVLYGANPFIRTPAEFPQSPLYYLVPLYWHDAPSVYGPLWVALSTGVAAASRSIALADEILIYRLIANAAHLTNVVLIWALACRVRRPAAPSAALAYGWNPLLLLEFSLNGHNDVLMLTFALAALLVASYQRLWAGSVLLGLSVAVKFTSGLIAPLLLYALARRKPGWPRRARALAAGAAIILGVVAATYALWIEGVETFGPVLYWMTGPRQNNFWPEPALISLTAWTAGLLGTSYEAVWEPLLAGFKLLAKAGLVAFILWEAARVRTVEQIMAAGARISLFFLLVVTTWVMPWYYTWPLALCAPLGWGSRLVRVCAGLTLTATVVMYQRQLGHAVVGEWAGLFLVLPVVMALIPWLGRVRASFGAPPSAPAASPARTPVRR